MTPEHVRPQEEYYVLASALAQRRPQVLLNHAESFAIFDLAGDIPLAYRDSYGLFHRGTRFLHRYELLMIEGGRPKDELLVRARYALRAKRRLAQALYCKPQPL